MENLTHSLTGYALARAGLDRFSPRAAVLLVLSANAPDLDILFLTQGRLQYFEAHRGYSHSVLLLPFMALLAVVVTAAIFRQRLPWLKAWLICCVGVASHLLIDWTNNYGVRLSAPVLVALVPRRSEQLVRRLDPARSSLWGALAAVFQAWLATKSEPARKHKGDRQLLRFSSFSLLIAVELFCTTRRSRNCNHGCSTERPH